MVTSYAWELMMKAAKPAPQVWYEETSPALASYHPFMRAVFALLIGRNIP
jgi:hypothetical protein